MKTDIQTMPHLCIRRLTEAGYHVEVLHSRASMRWVEDCRASQEKRPSRVGMKFDKNWDAASPCGGGTIVRISRKVGNNVPPLLDYLASGDSTCSAYDNFNRGIGLRVALGRALDTRTHGEIATARSGVRQELRAIALGLV